MIEIKNIDMDKLRKEFAQRINELIEEEAGEKKLEEFAKKTEVSARQLYQWKNEKQINWPDVKSIVQISTGAQVSPTWLLFGIEPRNIEIDPPARELSKSWSPKGVIDNVRQKHGERAGAAQQDGKKRPKEKGIGDISQGRTKKYSGRKS